MRIYGAKIDTVGRILEVAELVIKVIFSGKNVDIEAEMIDVGGSGQGWIIKDLLQSVPPVAKPGDLQRRLHCGPDLRGRGHCAPGRAH